jgi:2-oxoglutarate ferredoxin oxidoreductase subunit delta
MSGEFSVLIPLTWYDGKDIILNLHRYGAGRGPAPSNDRIARHKDEPMAKPKLKQHHINRDWCKGCGICVELCPKKVLELDDTDKVAVVRPQDCICCRMCELRCPDFAIEVETQE